MSSNIMHKQKKGQGIVEFVLVLPFLLLLAIGMVETGYAMYDYIVLANANREGVRLGSKGRYYDVKIVERVQQAGGKRTEDGELKNILDLESNFGIIVSHVPLNKDLTLSQVVQKQCCTTRDNPVCTADEYGDDTLVIFQCPGGRITEDGTDTPREVALTDSRIAQAIEDFEVNTDIGVLANELREDADYDPLDDHIVVVETFIAHPLLLHLPDYFPIPDPFTLYFRSSMRVTVASRR